MSQFYRFTLASESAKYLRDIVLAEDEFLSSIPFNNIDSEGKLIMKLDHETIEKLRTFLTEQLAKIGFTKNYSLTEDGKTLEELIDTFYVAPL